MPWQHTTYTTPILLAAGAVAVTAIYVVRQQLAYESVPGGQLAVLLSIAVSVTLLAYAVELTRVGRTAKIQWLQIQSLGIALVPALVFCFVLAYTLNRRYLNWWTVPLVLLVPAVMSVLILTNSIHSLVWNTLSVRTSDGIAVLETTPGMAMYGYAAYVGLVVVGSAFLLGRRARSAEGIYRRQALLLIAGTTVPLVAAVAEITGLIPGTKLKLPVVLLSITGLTAAWAIARHGRFTLVPIASRAAVEQMDDAVVVIDVHGLVANANQQAEPFLRDTATTVVGRTVGDVLRPVAVPPAPTEDSHESHEEVVTDPETGHHYRRVGTPLTDDDGTLIGQLIVMQDITERIHRETRLRQQNEQLEEFASVVSHDLRNPLNVISARSRLARETGDEEHFDALDRATSRMDQLIDELLELARQGQTVTETTQVRLQAVAADAWQFVEAPDATLETGGDLTLEADRDRLQQALENLFRNATDHAGEDVSLLIEPLDDGFAVVDDGPGIPPEKREAVFDFGHTTASDGTGFGLAIVSEIVEAHGWEIRVREESIWNDGTAYDGARFEITGISTSQPVAASADESEFAPS